ncbi:MAG: hypothetical protein VXZ59_08445 [Cyanobacteriota bacterium]|nr:hypothetical protein [Cyanobacteriota bacterium]
MSPLSLIQKRVQRKQRLEGARFLMAKAEGSFEPQVHNTLQFSALNNAASYRVMRDNWL